MVPLLSPPAAAVYLNASVLPADPASVEVGETVIEPEPSAETFANIAVAFWAVLVMLNLHVPSAAATLHPVMPVDWPLQPLNVEPAAGVALRLPSSLLPTETPQVFSQEALFFESVVSLTATAPVPVPAKVSSMFFAATLYGPTTGPPSPTGAAPAGSIELVELSPSARTRSRRPLPSVSRAWNKLRP